MLSHETIALLAMQQSALKNPKLYEAMKATYNQPTVSTPMVGFQAYQLLSLMTTIPVETPLLDEIPRSGGGFANTANWKVRNGLNTRHITAGVPEASRNQPVNISLYEYSAAFKTLYMEGSATLQARLAGKGFADVDALATQDALIAHKLENEQVILFGNTTSTGIALGKVANVVVTSPASTGGHIGAAVFVRVVALTGDGLRQITAYGVGDNVADDVGAVRTIHPTFGSTYTVNLGAGTPSDEATVGSLSGSTNTALVTWDSIPGAVAYAIYAGATTGGSVKFLDVAYVNKYTITQALATTTQVATAITGDRSQNAYVYDGIITQICRTDPNTGLTAGYVKSLGGATLTATGKGGVVEIDAFLIDRKKKFKVSKFDIWVGPDQTTNLTAKVTAGSSATPYMISVASGDVNLTGGQRVSFYSHPVTGEKLNVRYHPDLPPGMILFKITPAGLPAQYYQGNNIPAPWRIQEWLSYTSIVWPENTFQRDVGVVTAEVLQGFTPFANGGIFEIALG